MPRTTLDIDASVLRELKRRQRVEHKSLGRLVSELLAGAIEAESAGVSGAGRAGGARGPAPLVWVTKDLRPRVDLDDKDALWSVLDRQ